MNNGEIPPKCDRRCCLVLSCFCCISEDEEKNFFPLTDFILYKLNIQADLTHAFLDGHKLTAGVKIQICIIINFEE